MKVNLLKRPQAKRTEHVTRGGARPRILKLLERRGAARNPAVGTAVRAARSALSCCAAAAHGRRRLPAPTALARRRRRAGARGARSVRGCGRAARHRPSLARPVPARHDDEQRDIPVVSGHELQDELAVSLRMDPRTKRLPHLV